MTGAAIVSTNSGNPAPLLARPAHSMPVCLNCGSAYVYDVDARLNTGADLNGEVHSADGYDYVLLWSCECCGFIASRLGGAS